MPARTTPAPDAFGAWSDRLAGSLIWANGCEAFDVREGPAAGPIVLDWDRLGGRRTWLQAEFDRELDGFGGDLWRAFVELGGGLRQSTGGFAVAAEPTTEIAPCGGLDLPIWHVESVLGAYDLGQARLLSSSAEPLVPSGLDRDRLRPVIASATSGEHDEATIEVEGVTNRSLGCPLWALFDAGSVDYNCASRWGFVELRFADPSLAPDSDGVLQRYLRDAGVAELDELPRSQADELVERADRAARRGPFRYRGRFTGEISRHRGTEALFLTPVFIVEERVAH